MKSWVLTQAPELLPHSIDERRYEQLLDQIGKALYLYFASSNQKREITPALGSSTENHLIGRTRPERTGS